MNPILRNILAVVVAVVIGGMVNMGIIMLSGSLIPLPEGVDPNDMESINANIDKYETIHFLMPFLAHAMNAFVGALLAALIAATHKMRLAMGVSIFVLVGGIAAAFMIPAPTWFIVADLTLAYIPMGYLGARLGGAK